MFGLSIYFRPDFLGNLFLFGFLINAWIGLFNLIPFLMFDGKKILNWSKPAYFIMLSTGMILVSLTGFLEDIILKAVIA